MANARGGMPWHDTNQKIRVVATAGASIAALYGAGYLLVTSPAISGPSAAAARAALTPPARPGQYADGIYHGTASNGYGSVDVDVHIGGGRITRVEITGSSTFYPPSYIDGLPDKVVVAQSADIPVVSGATASWQDFTAAVEHALQQAAGRGSSS